MTLLNVNSGFNYEGKECFDCRQDGCPACTEWCIYGAVPQSVTITVQAVSPPAANALAVQNNGDLFFPINFPACNTGRANMGNAPVPPAHLECCGIDCQTDLNGTYNLPLWNSGGSSGNWCSTSYKKIYIFCDGTIQVGGQGLVSAGSTYAKVDPVTGKTVSARAELSASLAHSWWTFPSVHQFEAELTVIGNPYSTNLNTNALGAGCINFSDRWWQRYTKIWNVYPAGATQPVLQDCFDLSGGTHNSGVSGWPVTWGSPNRFFNLTVT